MSNTYNWIIEKLGVSPSLNGQSDVVTLIHWRVNGTDGTNNATQYGVQNIDFDANNTFIAFNNLTQQQVITWLQNSIGTDRFNEIQSLLDNQLNILANPPIVYPPLPWTPPFANLSS